MKNSRQDIILQIIAENIVETQEDLIHLLAERGIKATQATVSRDIKDLHLVKEAQIHGGYRYSVTSRKSRLNVEDKLNAIFMQSIINVDCAQNMVVIKTMSGLANAAAAALDGSNLDDMLGTIAGDDTVLSIFRDSESAADFCQIVKDQL